MGILVIALLLSSAAILLVSRRDRETLLLSFLALCLAEFWLIMLIYIAKKGGFGATLQLLLFGGRAMRVKLQYLIFTLGQLGYLTAIGRFLFPMALLWLAIYYARRVPHDQKGRYYALSALFPALWLILYEPRVFEWAIGLSPRAIIVLVRGSLAWIIGDLLLSAFLLLRELMEVSMRYYRRKMAGRVAMILSMAVLYALYCPQDPAQVYLFYRNAYMGAQLGLWYLNPALGPRIYLFVFALLILCTGVGVYGMIRYAWENIREDQANNAIRRKYVATSKGASVFIHSVKNQLLANRVLLRRVGLEMDRDAPDWQALRGYYEQLAQNNAFMIERMEELYRSIRTNSITLVPEPVDALFEAAVGRLRKKYPEARVDVRGAQGVTVLCDRNHLTEALCNLLINGWEAQQSAGCDTPLRLGVWQERLWTVLTVQDRGGGMSRAQQKHLFEPFSSSKNSNYNWGMGLYYVQRIVKSHLGVVRVETQLGQGTSFIVQLPRLRGEIAAPRGAKKEAGP